MRILWPRGTLHVDGAEIVPAADRPRSPNGSTRIYLLVHGFNNDRRQAEESYGKFRARLRDWIGLHAGQRIWEFYWPGYEEVVTAPLRENRVARDARSMYTSLCYRRQVPKAIRFGELLGEYLLRLRSRSQPTEVVLIGHSLGCRLILEALRAMQARGNASVPGVLLMAAAVPVRHLDAAGSLSAGMAVARHRIALYSTQDRVLRTAFPAGQTLARDGGWMPEALGLNGNPRKCLTAFDQTMLGHGDYWSDNATTPNIVRLFGKSTPHALRYSEIVARPVAVTTAPLPESVLRERRIGER